METFIPQAEYQLQRFNGHYWETIAAYLDEGEAKKAYETACKGPRSADIRFRLVQPYYRLISQTGASYEF